ncbi:CpaA pilus assembly protein CpaA [Sinorhizobium americanum CCGM7]|uniref:prepilin peptidase n=1 Tax=Sinorhizobium americanum TaxID=194963 RepID=UPI0004D7E586|nr:prepilin peptidase [Sinorhizobium americanum]APG85565.1 CpaA pilus assembly protein CpaA [Sinorhizobium americanum CCGM7]
MIGEINILIVATVLLLLYAAWSDFRLWKIPNAIVLALTAVYGLHAALQLLTAEDVGAALLSSNGIAGDLVSGVLLFILGFTFWSFRLFGAGDAKLFLPIGFFVGWHAMLPFSFFLLIGGILALLALKLPMPLQFAHYAVIMRVQEIRATRKIPYGVIMVAAALAVIALRPAGA